MRVLTLLLALFLFLAVAARADIAITDCELLPCLRCSESEVSLPFCEATGKRREVRCAGGHGDSGEQTDTKVHFESCAMVRAVWCVSRVGVE